MGEIKNKSEKPRIDVERIKVESKNKWLNIYEQLGIDVGIGKHQPCPSCAGTDRFRCDNKTGNGEYICGQCGAGDGFSLLMKVRGWTFMEAVENVADMLGIVEEDPDEPKKTTDPSLALNRLWKSSAKLIGSDPVSSYLHSRGLVLQPDNIRYCKSCYETDTKKELPAMIARIQSAKGKPISLHRTYLNGTGKADVPSPKKIMPGTESLIGSAVRLFTPGGMFEHDVLGVAEGIETAISATQMFKIATWAVLSTSVMMGFEPPEEYRKIIIFGDKDANYAGQKAACTLANKLFNKDLIVDVMIPEKVGDWNDVLTKQGGTNV